MRVFFTEYEKQTVLKITNLGKVYQNGCSVFFLQYPTFSNGFLQSLNERSDEFSGKNVNAFPVTVQTERKDRKQTIKTPNKACNSALSCVCLCPRR